MFLGIPNTTSNLVKTLLNKKAVKNAPKLSNKNNFSGVFYLMNANNQANSSATVGRIDF